MNLLHVIEKKFGPYPFAHRQPFHEGHCRLIHGHNWYFTVRMGVCEHVDLDESGFVFDFGAFLILKDWMRNTFDHTLLLQSNDPHLATLRAALESDFARIIVVPSVSCEGLSHLVYDKCLEFLMEAQTGRPIFLESVTVFEDEKNSAIYSPVIVNEKE